MFAVERGKTPGRLARSQDIRIPQPFLSRPRCSIVPSSDTSPSYVSFVSKAIIWERGLCNHSNHSVPHQGPLLCSRFLSHMKTRPEDVRPPFFLNSKSRPQTLCQEKPHAQSPSSPKNQQIEGHLDLKENKKYGDFHQKPVLEQSAAGAPGPFLNSTTPLPKIKPKPHNTIKPHHKRPPAYATPTACPSTQTFSATLQDALFGKTEEILSNINKTNSQMKLSQSPLEPQSSESPDSLSLISCSNLSRSPSSLSLISCSNLSHPPSSLFSHSLDLTPGRSSNLSVRTSAESTDPEGIICSPPVHSSRVLQTPVAPHHASLPLFSPANLSTYSLISSKPNGQTKAPSLPQTSPVAHTESKGDEADVELKCLYEETQFELGQTVTKNTSGHSTVPVCVKSSCPSSPLLPSADTSLKLSPSPPVSHLGSLWPVLPPIAVLKGRCNTAASCSSELSCSQSQVFDELDAIAPLSASCCSMDQPSESSQCASENTAFCSDALSPGLAALTVGCDSRHLGSMSRVQLLLLNRQETDAVSPFSLDEDLISMDNYPDLEMNNGVWRPLTAGSTSEKCGSTGKAHQNKLDDIEQGSGSSCSWIIDPTFNIFKSSDSQCNSSLGPLEDEVVSSKEPTNYLGFAGEDEDTCSIIERREVQDIKREERKTKVLKMLSKLQDDAPQQSTSSRGHSNFEDFDFLAKYCIFNHEKLTEYKRVFEEEDSDGDGYISCLQVLCALKNIIPPELLSEEEEIYVYRILEMVDFRVTDGLVDLRLFAVIASLAQKIATLDDFMRSLISSIDFRSLEVKLFKAKTLFLFLLEEQIVDGTSQQKCISPEQLILELKAGGICLEHEAAIRMEIQHIPPLDLLDFLAYLPLFMLIHKSVIANPLEDFGSL